MLRLITKHSEYGEFRAPDFYLRSGHFNAAVISSPGEFALGITISKRVGKAHLRNLLRRRIKAWLRENADSHPLGYKLNLIARSGAGELSWQELCNELDSMTANLRDRC
jgi:ribonuclease P protein component